MGNIFCPPEDSSDQDPLKYTKSVMGDIDLHARYTISNSVTGKGNQGKIYVGINRNDSSIKVAIKEIKKNDMLKKDLD